MRLNFRIFLTNGLLTAFITLQSIQVTYASNDPGLIGHMAKMQYFAHKLGLALAAKNNKLSNFYAHELEEVIEEVEEIKEYKGDAIGKLVKTILVPAFTSLKDQIKVEPQNAWQGYTKLLESCNRCHQTTKHEFININFEPGRSFLQTF